MPIKEFEPATCWGANPRSNQSSAPQEQTTHTHKYTYIYIHTCLLSKGFEPESFQLKYNLSTFEYKIHSVEVDVYYFKYL